MSDIVRESSGEYTYDFDRDTDLAAITQGTFQTYLINGNIGSTASTTNVASIWGAGIEGSESTGKHTRTIMRLYMPNKPSENGVFKITKFKFYVKTGDNTGANGFGSGGAETINVHPLEMAQLEMDDVRWEEFDDGVAWAAAGAEDDHDSSTNYGFGANGIIGNHPGLTAHNTGYWFDLTAYADKLEWGKKYMFIFKTARTDNPGSPDRVAECGLGSVSDTTLTCEFTFTDSVPEPPQISAKANIGGQSALIDVKVGSDKDLSDCTTVWTSDASEPEFQSGSGDNDNIIADSNPVTLNTANATHFDAGILSAENTRYRLAVYSRDMASTYVDTTPRTSGISRSNIIDLARPKINSVVVNSSFNTIGVEGQLTVAATTGGAWSSYGAASLKYLYILWDGPSTGATTNDDGVSKIEITDTDATSVVHTHTYSSSATKYVWVALEDTNGFMSGMHRIDDNDNNTGGVDGNIATPAALPNVSEADPICNITTSKSKFLAAKYADYNTGLIVSAAQSKAVGSDSKIQNYLFTCNAPKSTTIVTVNAFDNDNSVFDDSSKRVAVRALTDINTSAARLKITGLASFDSDGDPIIDTHSNFTTYKMVSETIAPPDAVLVEGNVDGTASGGDAYNIGNYSFNFFKTVESAVFTTGDTDDTEGIRYLLTAHTADWTSNNTGVTITEVDDGNELDLSITDATMFRSGDVVRIDNEYMKVTASDTDNNRLQITRQYLGTSGNSGVGSTEPVYLANPIVINSDLRFGSAATDADYHDRYRWGGFARILGEGGTGIDFEPFAGSTDTATNTIILQDIAAASSSFDDLCWYENGFFDDDIIMVGNTSSNGTYASPTFYKLASFITGGSSNYETAVIHGSNHDLPSWVYNSIANEDNTAADIVRIISNPSRTIAAMNTDNEEDVITFEARVIDNDATSFVVNTDLATTSSVMVQPESLDLDTVATYGTRLTTSDIAILNANLTRDGGLKTVMPLGERKYPMGVTRATMGLPTMSVNIRVLSQTGYKSLLSLIEGDTYDYAFMDSTQVDTPTSAYVTFRMKYVSGNLTKSPDIANEYLASLNFVIVGEAVTV